MKNLFILLSFSFCLFSSAMAQENRPHDAYWAGDQGYFNTLLPTDFGIVATSNNCNDIYLISDGELKTLVSAPGCGRYMHLGPDGKTIGFKYISEKGMQTPALLDIVTGNISFLSEPAALCGQPSFSASGDIVIADTTGFTVYRKNGNENKSISGYYSNFTALSPDGDLVVYNDKNDQLKMVNTYSHEVTVISPEGCALPEFSASGKFISFVSSLQRIFIYSMEQNSIVDTLYGTATQWHPSEDILAYNYLESENYTVSRAEIKLFDAKTGSISTIAGGSESLYFDPAFDKNGVVYYHDQTQLGIYRLQNNAQQEVYRHAGALPMSFYEIDKSTLSIITVPGTVPYVHQVYDTPTWHSGYSSCAPTTAIMAVAYYNRLPAWPVTVDHGMSWDPHVNNFGSYVADRYRFDEWYYSETAPDYADATSYGGYGYMWTGSYSPNSRMSDYMEQHYMTSNQYWTTSCTWAATLAEIDNGYVHPICNYLTTSGHLTLCIGYYNTQHSLLFNDPYGDRNDATYCDYDGAGVSYDWPGYNNGLANLGGSYSYVAWTVAARTTEPVYNDTIIDNNYYNHGFYVNNSTLGSHMRYFRDFNVGYNGHTWFTLGMATDPDICYTTWTPVFSGTKLYRVSAFIPSKGTSTTNAMYHINRVGTDTIVHVNQATHKNSWVELGVFEMAPGDASVYLGDSTGVDGDSIAFDAVRWEKYPIPVSQFSADNTTICPGSTVVFTSSSLYATSLAWNCPGGTPQGQTANTYTVSYNTAGTYDVSLIAINLNGSDTLEYSQYIVVSPDASAQFIASDDTVPVSNPMITFTNQSQNADSYLWHFGDGATSNDINPYHSYASTPASYTVLLEALSGTCADDSSTALVVVVSTTGINDDHNNLIHLYPNPVEDMIYIQYELNNAATYNIFDAAGKLILHGSISGTTTIINISGLAEGLYSLVVSDAEQKTSFSFVKK